jgi:hypothetical protein
MVGIMLGRTGEGGGYCYGMEGMEMEFVYHVYKPPPLPVHYVEKIF